MYVEIAFNASHLLINLKPRYDLCLREHSFKNKRQVMNATTAHLLAKQATEGEPLDSSKQSSRSDVEPEPQLEAHRNPGDVELSVIHRGPRKRKFIDPQPGALRVEFETQGSSLLDKSENHPQSIPIEATTDQEESDIEYQQDTRASIKTPRRSRHVPRKRLASRAVSLLPERARHTIRIDNRQETDTSDASTRHDQLSRPSQGERIKQANSKAKLMKPMAPRKVQTRKAWTDEETKTLIELIEAHGTSWSRIKALGDDNQHHIFKNRDQIGLKDKARNIKLDFLK